jgi:HrpA-like RNA helicase
LTLFHDEPLSSFAFHFNLRHYTKGVSADRLGAVLIFLPGQAEIKNLIRRCEQSRYLEEHEVGRLMFLPLYGALSSNDQKQIFAAPPPGVRKIVVATNIAETSVGSGR